jgi:hypothetical protein
VFLLLPSFIIIRRFDFSRYIVFFSIYTLRYTLYLIHGKDKIYLEKPK